MLYGFYDFKEKFIDSAKYVLSSVPGSVVDSGD